MFTKKTIIFVLVLCFSFIPFSQSASQEKLKNKSEETNTNNKNRTQRQTIRGIVIDADTKIPLIGANVYIDSKSPFIGTATNHKGYFKIENLPVGRYTLKASYIGYTPAVIPNILILSGKEKMITINMEESTTGLKNVSVVFESNKTKPVNNLAFISSRRISSVELEYVPGSINDISRAAVSFPGVVSANDGQNLLIIRGNSPKGLQWRLEGIEIPNLNHFAEIGSSGGGVGIISNNMIAESDFMISAFPSEYGNALSGVFDLKLRSGNNEKHEQTFQVGVIGTELMVEGPLNRKSGASYIAQYRYSTLALFEKLGVDMPNNVDFQDLSFKFMIPTKKTGTFSVFGIGGLSHEVGDIGYDNNSNMATLGFTNNYIINSTTWLKSTIALSGWSYKWNETDEIGTEYELIDYNYFSNVDEFSFKVSVNINKKINARHKLKAGLVYDNTFYDNNRGWYSDTLFNWWKKSGHSDEINYQDIYTDTEGNAQTFQAYGNWKYRITENLTINSGLHFIKFYLNNNYSLEPRFGISWQFLSRHALSMGFGIHSRKESLTLYTGQKTLSTGEVIQPNMGLELTKARHYVIGYNYSVNKYLRLKAEVYYQYLYDIPVYTFPPYFSSINFDNSFESNQLINDGTAWNKGIELTLEKFFSNGFYFLVNGTIYDSKYKNYLGEEFDTRYNGSYAANAMFMKEIVVGKQKQNLFAVGIRGIYMGGMRYLPIDPEASVAQNRETIIWDDGFSGKANDYFRIDLQLSFTRNRLRHTGKWSLDILNLTNQKNMLRMRYDRSKQAVITEYQNPLIPVLSYKISF